MLTQLTQAAFQSLVSTDELKPALNYVSYEPFKTVEGKKTKEYGRLVVTDGHKLLMYEVTAERGDSPMLIPVPLFEKKAPRGATGDFSKFYLKRKGRKTFVVSENLVDKSLTQVEQTVEDYPDVDLVVPKTPHRFHIGVDTALIVDLHRALKTIVPRDSATAIDMGIDNEVGAITITPPESIDYPKFKGLLMPVRLTQWSRWGGESKQPVDEARLKAIKSVLGFKPETLLADENLRNVLINSLSFKATLDKALKDFLTGLNAKGRELVAREPMVSEQVYKSFTNKVISKMVHYKAKKERERNG